MTRPLVEIREDILTFDPHDQEKWVGDDKSMVPEEFRDDPRFTKSPRAHFLEMSAVHHYTCGGNTALASIWFELWSKSEKRKGHLEKGSALFEAFVGPELQGFQSKLGADIAKFAKSPDVVVMRAQPRRLIFCSIKQKNETVTPMEFAGLALVKAHLGADVRIVRFCELGDFRDPRRWRVRCPSIPVSAGFDRHDVQRVEE